MENLVENLPFPPSDLPGGNAHASVGRPAPKADRIILDTNVCLDLFIFRDLRCAQLLEAMRTQRVEAVTRVDCRAEWRIVLRYPKLPIDDTLRREAEQEFDALITCIETDTMEGTPAVKLPICKDKDDQKFLEAARSTGASTLITKDKALLKLARKTVRAGLFRIILPQDWKPEAGPVPDGG